MILLMDAHPVPQNVTSFEFHLIGDMTLKQFVYLAGGLVTGYLVFFILYPYSPVLAIPIIFLSVSLGAALAFLPIADRPLDHWLVAFFRAVYSPTKGLWKSNFNKQTVDPASPQFRNRLNVYLSSFGSLPPTVEAAPSQTEETPAETKIKGLTRILSNSQEDSRPHGAPAVATVNQAEANPLLQQNQLLRQQLASLQQQLHQATPQPIVNPVPVIAPAIQPPPIQTAPPVPVVQSPPPVQLKPVAPSNITLSNSPMVAGPNIIAGTVIDQAGSVVEGAIIVTTDQNNVPVRALKTTKLGQFTGATPLPNGVYIVAVEKDGFVFNPVQIELKGELVQPLVIQAK